MIICVVCVRCNTNRLHAANVHTTHANVERYINSSACDFVALLSNIAFATFSARRLLYDRCVALASEREAQTANDSITECKLCANNPNARLWLAIEAQRFDNALQPGMFVIVFIV